MDIVTVFIYNIQN